MSEKSLHDLLTILEELGTELYGEITMDVLTL